MSKGSKWRTGVDMGTFYDNFDKIFKKKDSEEESKSVKKEETKPTQESKWYPPR